MIKNKDVTVDYKEYSAPAYKVKRIYKHDGSAVSTCVTNIVVHYHEGDE